MVKDNNNLHEDLYSILKELVKYLKINNYMYMPAYGTLLGFSREGKIIDWDTDLDIAIFGVKPEDEYLVSSAVANYLYKNLHESYSISVKHKNNYIFKDVNGTEVLNLIFYQWSRHNRRLEVWNAYGTKGYLSKNDLVLFDKKLIHGIEVEIPANYAKILTNIYGNWEEPLGESANAEANRVEP